MVARNFEPPSQIAWWPGAARTSASSRPISLLCGTGDKSLDEIVNPPCKESGVQSSRHSLAAVVPIRESDSQRLAPQALPSLQASAACVHGLTMYSACLQDPDTLPPPSPRSPLELGGKRPKGADDHRIARRSCTPRRRPDQSDLYELPRASDDSPMSLSGVRRPSEGPPVHAGLASRD